MTFFERKINKGRGQNEKLIPSLGERKDRGRNAVQSVQNERCAIRGQTRGRGKWSVGEKGEERLWLGKVGGVNVEHAIISTREMQVMQPKPRIKSMRRMK